MTSDHVKDITMFQKIIDYNTKFLKHTIVRVSQESGLSMPTIKVILNEKFSVDSTLRASTLAKAQDYNRRYIDTRNYLLSAAHNESFNISEKKEKPKKERKVYIRKQDVHPYERRLVKRSASETNGGKSKVDAYDDFIPEPKEIYTPVLSSELVASIRKEFSGAEIEFHITIKTPRL